MAHFFAGLYIKILVDEHTPSGPARPLDNFMDIAGRVFDPPPLEVLSYISARREVRVGQGSVICRIGESEGDNPLPSQPPPQLSHQLKHLILVNVSEDGKSQNHIESHIEIRPWKIANTTGVELGAVTIEMNEIRARELPAALLERASLHIQAPV